MLPLQVVIMMVLAMMVIVMFLLMMIIRNCNGGNDWGRVIVPFPNLR